MICVHCSLGTTVGTYEIRQSRPFAIQPLYACAFTTTNQFRVRGPRDTRLLFNGNGDSELRQASVSGSRQEFEGSVPITQNAVIFKSDSSEEEMMIILGDNVNMEYRPEISQFIETELEVGISRVVMDTNTTIRTTFSRTGDSYIIIRYIVLLEQNGRILSDTSEYYSRMENTEANTFDAVFETHKMEFAGVKVKSLYLEVKPRAVYSGTMQAKWFLPIISGL
mmetsp:Transcript_35430/g.56649  ORF Transcript_35430/g.56649 Transcript_35430/m.56649 type:complete len:223 (-) Transcript_35430:36-704(-)